MHDWTVLAGKAFQPNLQDARFKSLFTSADFALDPTDPRFTQTEGSNSIAQQVAKQRKQRLAEHTVHATLATPDAQATPAAEAATIQQPEAKPKILPGAADDAAQMKAMVASLKRKSHKQANGSRLVPAAANGQAAAKKRKKQNLAS